MRYSHIFWDFNGTIIDDVGNALQCVNDMLERKGRQPITLDDYYTYVETPIIGFYRHILPPDELDFQDISRQYHSDYARHINETGLAEGAYELLHKLKAMGVHQYIITANILSEAEELIEKFGISACFDKILGAENTLAESKIDRAKVFFKELNINRNDAILIGDTLHDLETANALGIDCVLVSYGHQGRRLLEEHNAFTVNSLKDVEKILFDNRIVDFHTHSTCSDGTLTPKELVNHAKKSGLSAFALTDHDSVDGIKEAKEEAERTGIEFIPGIEFSAAENTETHIIGLFINPENETLLKTIEKLKGSRKRRMEEICFKLRNLGMDITHDEALEIAGGNFVGRAHIAKLMVEKGYCETIKECFEKYIGLGKPAYAEKNELSAVEAVKAIRAAGGLAFLAHLNQTGYSLEQLEELLLKLKSAGLNGIEGYYPEYTAEQISDYRALAEKLSLCFSGGSDYHAAMKPHIQIGVGTGDLYIPYFVLQNMKNILKID
ncbi:MAG: HAD hydrolase-like protein [Clostridia bacterium]|nr:HAD hydrolase-like protein [Clostridia bacterium]